MADSYHERWLVDQTYQRHLLQLEFTDRRLGSSSATAADRSVGPLAVILTADTGESFGPSATGT